MVRQFAPPVDVAPLIRLGRWGMLFTGIVYGAYRHRSLQNYENERRQLKRQQNNAFDRNIPEATTAPGEGGDNDDACSAGRQNTIITENRIPVDLKKTAASLVSKDTSDERRKVTVDNPNSSNPEVINPANVIEDPTKGGRNAVIDNPISTDQKSTNSAVILKDTAAYLVPKDPYDERSKVVVDNPISSDTKESNPANVIEDPSNGVRIVDIDNPISADQKNTNSTVILKDPFGEHRSITIIDVNERRVPNDGADKSEEENDSNGFKVA